MKFCVAAMFTTLPIYVVYVIVYKHIPTQSGNGQPG